MSLRAEGRHTAPKQRTGWRRRIVGVPVAWWLLAGTAAAVAGFVILLGVSGTLTAGDGADVRYGEASPTATAVAGSPTCGASSVSTSEVEFTASGVQPGDACQFRAIVENIGAQSAYLQGFNLDSPDFTGGEVTAAVGAQCGLELPPGVPAAAWATVVVTFGDVSPGQTFTFQPTLDGFDWETAAPAPGTCT